MNSINITDMMEMKEEMKQHIDWADKVLWDGLFAADVETAEAHYDIAIDICKDLVRINFDLYKPYLAKIYVKAAIAYTLYKRNQNYQPQYQKAEPLFLNAVEVLQSLIEQEGDNNYNELARVYKLLGNTYVNLKERKHAKFYLKKSKEMYTILLKRDRRYELDITHIYEYLAQNTSWMNFLLKNFYYSVYIFRLFKPSHKIDAD